MQQLRHWRPVHRLIKWQFASLETSTANDNPQWYQSLAERSMISHTWRYRARLETWRLVPVDWRYSPQLPRQVFTWHGCLAIYGSALACARAWIDGWGQEIDDPIDCVTICQESQLERLWHYVKDSMLHEAWDTQGPGVKVPPPGVRETPPIRHTPRFYSRDVVSPSLWFVWYQHLTAFVLLFQLALQQTSSHPVRVCDLALVTVVPWSEGYYP